MFDKFFNASCHENVLIGLNLPAKFITANSFWSPFNVGSFLKCSFSLFYKNKICIHGNLPCNLKFILEGVVG